MTPIRAALDFTHSVHLAKMQPPDIPTSCVVVQYVVKVCSDRLNDMR